MNAKMVKFMFDAKWARRIAELRPNDKADAPRRDRRVQRQRLHVSGVDYDYRPLRLTGRDVA